MANFRVGQKARYGHPSVERRGDRHEYLRLQLRMLREDLSVEDRRSLIAPYMHVSDIPDNEIYSFNVAVENARIARARAA